MGLQEYRRKRDFSKTKEPTGSKGRTGSGSIFVVQKHAASHLHYDFRLELDGVLKSWAVPKGPDLNPSNKRLAMHVEDHPIEYAGFEGIIPRGEYGGGTVMLWDRGTWEPLEDPRKGYREGHLKFALHGEKLEGNWMLVRKGGKKGGPNERHWFLFKEKDRYANTKKPIVEIKPLSVASGRDLDQIAAEADRVWGKSGEIVKRKTQRTSPAKRGLKSEPGRSRSVGSGKNSSKDESVVIERVALSHPDKVLYPEQGITKRDLAEYYLRVADWMLPHVINRPLALVRCPGGRGKPCFFQKHPSEGGPTFLKEVDVSETKKVELNLMIKDVSGLIELVQMGVLEIHVWGSQARTLEKPNRLIFDLDPDPNVDWSDVVQSARELRSVIEELGLKTFLKTTGGKGLHIVVPVQPKTEWEEAKAFCKAVADFMARVGPERYIATMSKAARKGKVFIDYLRNGRGATAVAAYSTRSRPGAPVSVPISWDELSVRLRPDAYHLTDLPARLKKLRRDPWEGIGETKQSLTASMLQRLSQ